MDRGAWQATDHRIPQSQTRVKKHSRHTHTHLEKKNYTISSVTQSCPTLCNPMNRSTTGLHVHQQLPESTQTHVHRVSDAIQPSHLLSYPSPPALNLSQHHGHFQ